jgi:2,4-dienoyl-CoA reductase-like NADH-dependent reductase (Old Yellow Enzyme family)
MVNNINSPSPIDPFGPFKVRQLQLTNRFMRSATYDGSADNTGAATEASLELYRRLGLAGIGLVVTGHAFVAAEGQAGPGQYGIHRDEMIPGLSRLVKAVHKGGGKIAVQIAHCGINSGYLEGKGIAALAVSLTAEAKQPHRQMTDEDIEKTIAAFSAAARRAVEAGFDAVQVHGAHGYLISQFLSPVTNTRQDAWGGSMEKRRRFPIEVIKSVRKMIGNNLPLIVKFGVKDDIEGGMQLEDGIETARQMVANGVDAIEVSGGIGLTSVVKGNAYFRNRAAIVKRSVTVPVAAVGGIRNLETVHSILDSGDADMISMSRPFIREPALLIRWQKESKEAATCISCNRCMVFTRRGLPVQCAQDKQTTKSGPGAPVK